MTRLWCIFQQRIVMTEQHQPPPLQALEALPEHLLLRVLRAWAAPLPTQLATLPRRMHAAVISAAHPSVETNRCVTIGCLEPHAFRHALRAVAALGRMRRVDTVTLPPPRRSARCPQLSRHMSPMHLVARQLRLLAAVTSLHLDKMPRSWLRSNDMHGLTCITSMPHLRAVGVADVKQNLVPALVAILAPMPHLRELRLGVCLIPLVVDGCWGGAGLVRELTALTALEAVNLKLQYKRIGLRRHAGAVDRVAPLLRTVDEKRVQLLQGHFSWEGKRRPADVLGALGAAAPRRARLDLSRCGVEEKGEGWFEYLAPAAVAALWGALMASPPPGPPTVVKMLAAGASRLGTRLDASASVVIVPPAALGDLPGLQHLMMLGPEELAVDSGDAAVLGRHLYRLTQLTTLYCGEIALGRAGARMLLPRLSALCALQELVLHGCCIGPDGGEALAAALPRLGTLRHLDIGENDLGERGAAAVVSALAPAAITGMSLLTLGWNGIGIGGAAELAARLPEMTSLAELHLAANRIMGGEGMKTLFGGLAARGVRLTALTSLDLRSNFLECDGAAALAGLLPRLPNLSCLDLHANAIAARGMQRLAQQVGQMPELRTLGMSYNCVGNTGAQALACMLRGSTHIRHVSNVHAYVSYNLERNGIADAGALALADALWGVVESGTGTSVFVAELLTNEVSARVWSHIARRTAHVNREIHRLWLCHGEDSAGDITQDELHEVMAG